MNRPLTPAQILMLRCSGNDSDPVHLQGAANFTTARALERRGLGRLYHGLPRPKHRTSAYFIANPAGVAALLEQEAQP